MYVNASVLYFYLHNDSELRGYPKSLGKGAQKKLAAVHPVAKLKKEELSEDPVS